MSVFTQWCDCMLKPSMGGKRLISVRAFVVITLVYFEFSNAREKY